MLHKLKIRECFAEAVFCGEKTFEVRYNADRGFQKGDRVLFTVVDKDGKPIEHKLNNELYVITYVLYGWGLKEDYAAFSIKNVRDAV